jgi:DUF1680 family protein
MLIDGRRRNRENTTMKRACSSGSVRFVLAGRVGARLPLLAMLPILLTAATAGDAARGTPPADAVYLRGFGAKDTRWTEGFWAQQQEICLTQTIPSVRRMIDRPGSRAAYTNFKILAGESSAAKGTCHWGDGDVYKYLEALGYALQQTGDPALDRELDERIAVIARAQQPDGYLHTVNQLAAGNPRWTKRSDHEDYNFGHLFTAAAVHHAVTGKRSLLAVARRSADLLIAEFQGQRERAATFGWNPSHLMGLVDLYQATGDRRYLELCRTFVDARGTMPTPRFPTIAEPNPGDQNQMRRPLRQETEAVGHAVTATYLYCGAADLARETGDARLFGALSRIWDDIVATKLYVTGGVAAYHHGLSPRNDLVHEAFGQAYDLPLAPAYNETCASFGFAMFCRRLLEATGDARYADWMEQTLYNACLAAVSLDGSRFFYVNPLAWQREDQKLLNNDARERWSDWNCLCCPPQVARVFAPLHRWAWGTRGDDIWVHLYGGGRLTTELAGKGRVDLEQRTDYPWSGTVRFDWKAAPSGETTLRLRLPGWASGATVKVNGRSVPAQAGAGGYLALPRTWRAGDTVELELPLAVRLIEANPLAEPMAHKAAVLRGPVVYCLESPDLPIGVAVHEVLLPRNVAFETVALKAPLERVRGLRGTLQARPVLAPKRSGPLYALVDPAPARPVPVTLIPYFAWNNRGEPRMSVWLPLAD